MLVLQQKITGVQHVSDIYVDDEILVCMFVAKVRLLFYPHASFGFVLFSKIYTHKRWSNALLRVL